ncbi:MAG: prolyl oligopeptidase family serine peptidase [Propionibacteriaceae bacterium]|nr:prolyl oligopeptidase family serine peptidase [Propionibacteriaceae bacterium]
MLTYPTTRTDGPEDDPYRWLEGTGPEVAAFVEEQNRLSGSVLATLPARQAFLASVTALLTAPTRGCPFVRGGRYFAWHNDGTNQDVLVTAEDLDGLEPGRVLLDPNSFSADGTVSVGAAAVNPAGTLLAYCVSDGGSDWWTIRVREVASGADTGDVIEWCKWQVPVWLPDGRSFSYWAYDAPAGAALTEEQGAGRLMRHTVGTPASADEVLFAEPDEPRLFAHHHPRDDEWFVLATNTGASLGNDLRARRWDAAEWTHLVTGRDDEWRPVGIRAGLLYALTNADAPRYRLVAIDLATGQRRTVVAEHGTDVLLEAELTASGLVLCYSHDAQHRVQLASDDGAPGEELPLGGGVSVVAIETSDGDEFFVKTSSYVDRGTRHAVTRDGGRVVSHRALPSPGRPAPQAETTRMWATSKDGTRVPAFVVRATRQAGPRPTLIWGYGGFNIAMNPEFRAVLAAWVAAGGVLCVPNLRGGGEFGSDWHRAGTKERKQNVFDDLYAVAEELVSSGVTTTAQLALHGRSNGGLLAGAALTQRPDLWAAVLPGVGVLDMARFHKFTIGWAWADDYGDPDDGALDYLLAYSPLHNVRPGTRYPATLVTTGDHDDRVVPAHSYKFAAALQAAQAGEAPVILSVDTRAGHGAGKPKDAAAAEFANQLAFAAHFTGLDASPEPD